jgi:hypothetical protein
VQTPTSDRISRVAMDISIDVAAPPSAVWPLLDPRRMGDVSPMCTGARWPDGVEGPAVGVRFQGTNSSGWHRWRTTATIVAAVPERELAWAVAFLGFSVSQWGYRLAPLPDGGTRLTETWRDLRTSPLLHLKPVVRLVTGQRDVPAAVEAGIRATLAKVKAAAEAAARPAPV